ncbi:MAG: hypothetical protein IVW56_09095 [Candidatus Binataceae bacterium]|nr:hypothetical protein [Candidatus Binataceae bacterium]
MRSLENGRARHRSCTRNFKGVSVQKMLIVYQSKLSESKAAALAGLADLNRARAWLEEVIVDGTVATIPNDNHCLFNLYTKLSEARNTLQRVEFKLISCFRKNDLEGFAKIQRVRKWPSQI